MIKLEVVIETHQVFGTLQFVERRCRAHQALCAALLHGKSCAGISAHSLYRSSNSFLVSGRRLQREHHRPTDQCSGILCAVRFSARAKVDIEAAGRAGPLDKPAARWVGVAARASDPARRARPWFAPGRCRAQRICSSNATVKQKDSGHLLASGFMASSRKSLTASG